MSKYTGLTKSLSALNELTKKIEILKSERDEYRRKWLEAIDSVTDVGNENQISNRFLVKLLIVNTFICEQVIIWYDIAHW